MLFHIRWAVKNLLSDKKRTAKKMAFMVLAVSMILACIALLNGSSRQMRESLYYSLGDIRAEARTKKGNIVEVRKDMQELFKGRGVLFQEYHQNGQLIGPAGYASARIRGVEPAYMSYFSRTIGWNEALKGEFKRGSILLEAGLAAKVQAHKGDSVSIRIRAEEGFVNANQFKVAGIYMGNPWLYKNTVLLRIEDVRELFSKDDAVNTLTGFFFNKKQSGELRTLVSPLDIKYSRIALFSTRTDMENSNVVMVFGYYRAFMIFILSIVILTFIIILYFSIQNIYFVEYRTRRKELATLLTFGMKPGSLMVVVFFETLLVFLVSLLFSFIILFALGGALSLFKITDISYQQAVVLLGGNSIVLSYVPLNLAVFSVLIFLITVRSSLRGAKSYLKMHIREIITID